jgi:hypothetical protein
LLGNKHGITLPDESSLLNADVLECAKAIERVLIVHDRADALDIVGMKSGSVSPTISVALSAAAAGVANASRCWLFDGIFTPLVVELLDQDAVFDPICPERIITAATAALGSRDIPDGSFTGHAASAMCFFKHHEDSQ